MRKKTKRVLLPIAYTAVLAIIVLGTVVLVAVGRGYSYNFRSGRFVLNGLVIVASSPNGAKVYINSKELRRKTPYRATMESGDYDMEIIKDGYRTWRKRISILASEVTFLQYIFLFPNEIKSQNVTLLAPPTILSGSPDGRRQAYATIDPSPGVWLLDIGNREGSKLYTPQAATDTAPAETVSGITWSADASHLLVHSRLGDANKYIVLAAGQNGGPINLTELFRFEFQDLKFNPSNWRELYFISAEGLRRIDVSSQTVSAVLADKVLSYGFGADRIFYVQAGALGNSLWSLDRDGRKQEIIQSIPGSSQFQIIYSNYHSKDTLAVLPKDSKTLSVYTDIFTNTVKSKVVTKDASDISLSPEGRFIAYHGGMVGTYDLDSGLGWTVNVGEKVQELSWMSDFHLLISAGSKLVVTEFDGANQVLLHEGVTGAAFATADQKTVAAISTASGSNNLILLELKR